MPLSSGTAEHVHLDGHDTAGDTLQLLPAAVCAVPVAQSESPSMHTRSDVAVGAAVSTRSDS